MHFKDFDIHSHLNLKEFDADRDAVIRRMAEEGVGTITVGVDCESSEKAIAYAKQYEHMYACVGMHPTDNKDEVFDDAVFTELAKHPKVVAIGECGLDYFRLQGTLEEIEIEKERQKELFIKQIDLAQSVGK